MVATARGQRSLASRWRCLAVLGVAGLLCAACCGGHSDTKAAPASGQPARGPADSLRLSVTLDKGSYVIGERMRIRLVVANVVGRPVAVVFPTAQRFDFIVKREGKPVWQWAAAMMFAQTMARETIASRDSLVFEATWDQVIADGTNLGLGAYTIEGVLKTNPEIVTADKRFGVVD
jgi:Intracellular proteinase inhibitor